MNCFRKKNEDDSERELGRGTPEPSLAWLIDLTRLKNCFPNFSRDHPLDAAELRQPLWREHQPADVQPPIRRNAHHQVPAQANIE